MENNKNEYYVFEQETKQKIGAVTYIVAAHFDGNRDNLKTKINRLLFSEIDRQITAQMSGLSQNSVI